MKNKTVAEPEWILWDSAVLEPAGPCCLEGEGLVITQWIELIYNLINRIDTSHMGGGGSFSASLPQSESRFKVQAFQSH